MSMAQIFRGSTPIIYDKPVNGMDISNMGDPIFAFTQYGTVITVSGERVNYDITNNRIWVKLTQEETMQFGSESTVQMQVVWANDDLSNVLRFPIHKIKIMDTIIDELEIEVTPENEPVS